MSLPQQDRTILRDLARQVAAIAADPIQKEKAALWCTLNSVRRVRPLVIIQNGTWHETGGEIKTQCQDKWAQGVEWGLRARLYHWEHTRDDAIQTDIVRTWLPMDWGDIGIKGDATRPTDATFGAAHFNTVLDDDADPQMMKMPVVTWNEAAAAEEFQRHQDLYGDILRVERGAMAFHWFAPMDQFIQWRGLEKTFTDMLDRPKYVHAWMARLTEHMMSALDQLEEKGLLALNNRADWCGPGGMGWTDDLPAKDFAGKVRTIDQWGHAATQIFAEVSPAMHEEFALTYEKQFLARFGLASYGCCEPLHKKVHILRSIPNLRRISMSPWVDTAIGAEAIGKDFIFSYKPNPAFLGMESWDIAPARDQLRKCLEDTRGCAVEIILKDLHTVRGQPRRMWDWVKMAMEMVQEYA